MKTSSESGFTLVELMVGMLLLSILSIGFYQVMFSTVRGSNRTSDIAEMAEEARLGFNRMIRDSRETTQLVSATGSDYRIWVDFDADGCVDAGTAFEKVAPSTECVAGGPADYEYLRYAYTGSRITLEALQGPGSGAAATCFPAPAPACGLDPGDSALVAGTETETLAASVRRVEDPPNSGTFRDVFSYVSNFLQFDNAPANGEVSVAELEAGTFGDNNGVLEGLELDYVSDINYAFNVSVEGNTRTFFGQAQIRNRRYSEL